MYVAEVVNNRDLVTPLTATEGVSHDSGPIGLHNPIDTPNPIEFHRGAETGSSVPLVQRAGILDLVELILKHRPAAERIIRNAPIRTELAPRFLAISIASFALYSVAMSLVLQSAHVWPHVAPIQAYLNGMTDSLVTFETSSSLLAHWLDGSAVHLVVAYTVGLIAATGICLPSLYFYGLLAGVRMSLLDVVLHALKSKATAAIALIGLLPIYAALAMGVIVLGITGLPQHIVLLIGLMLPFIAGLWGTWSLYHGFLGLCDTMAANRREQRLCFLRRLVLAWSGCYTAISPVMIYTLWEILDRS